MNLQLRVVEDSEEASRLASHFQVGAEESSEAFRVESLPEDSVARMLARFSGRPEALILVGETAGWEQPPAYLVTVPFEDPLDASVLPLIAVMYVEPALRHRGIARALVSEARRVLATRGVHGLAARAAHNDDALISMGERFGLVREWELMVGD